MHKEIFRANRHICRNCGSEEFEWYGSTFYDGERIEEGACVKCHSKHSRVFDFYYIYTELIDSKEKHYDKETTCPNCGSFLDKDEGERHSKDKKIWWVVKCPNPKCKKHSAVVYDDVYQFSVAEVEERE
ncbi:hypothetical protein [Pseudolactococcus insecticola]|uniref:Uncharacterized protein n=1 Tax=Pseudolactococcus insecticola TaxID=2709158 RepID=A0A6A0BAE7_9LACT|nr:hypothetical protein [Lactococcus insecticola]GFH40797.1 hypothetical protein Hs20B_11950 [Lactococcus insecticola]